MRIVFTDRYGRRAFVGMPTVSKALQAHCRCTLTLQVESMHGALICVLLSPQSQCGMLPFYAEHND